LQQVSLIIGDWLRINRDVITRNGERLLTVDEAAPGPESFYRSLQYNYPKFFKMDALCKWAWLAAEALLSGQAGVVYEGMDRNKIALVLTTSHGCIDVDRKYSETLATVPSPALFVYTLPNIMLGEICIRHGFKGEQACMMAESFDSKELYFWAADLLQNRGMDACLCGWVDVAGDARDVCLFWVAKGTTGIRFSPEAIEDLYKA
jgi:hypothetical protein